MTPGAYHHTEMSREVSGISQRLLQRCVHPPTAPCVACNEHQWRRHIFTALLIPCHERLMSLLSGTAGSSELRGRQG